MRHASEFWMIEPEIAFADLSDDMDLIEEMLKYVVNYILQNASEELKFFDEFVAPGKIKQLEDLVNSTIVRCDYRKAIEILSKHNDKFENKIKFGDDLATEHEKYFD